MRRLGAWIIAGLALAWAGALASADAAPSFRAAAEANLVAGVAASGPVLVEARSPGRRATVPAPFAEEAEGPDDDEAGLRVPASRSGRAPEGACLSSGLAVAPGAASAGRWTLATGPPAA